MSRLQRVLSIPFGIALLVFVAQVFSRGEAAESQASAARQPKIHAILVNMPKVERGGEVSGALDLDSLTGHSGDLRVRLMLSGETDSYPAMKRRFGGELHTPGIRAAHVKAGIDSFNFVTLVPWTRKLGSHLNGYHVGYWPAEQTRGRAQPGYENPEGFIEVTRANAATRLSAHFALKDFVTHDQDHVWPKYVVVREELLDKLELVLDALQSFGVPTHHVVVLSGFRSPQYNSRGMGEGMARSSRHQFGDAADIIIDVNRDGRMDDLDGDGRLTFADLRVLDRAVQLVEKRYPELVGGLGLYHEMGPSGPFAHIDVRGTRARWTNGGRPRRPTQAPQSVAATARASGTCTAEGESAILCVGVK